MFRVSWLKKLPLTTCCMNMIQILLQYLKLGLKQKFCQVSFSRFRPNGHGRVLIAWHNSLNCYHLNINCDTEAIACQCTLANHQTLIMHAFYRPPKPSQQDNKESRYLGLSKDQTRPQPQRFFAYALYTYKITAFAKMVLHIGQVPMLVYNILSVSLSNKLTKLFFVLLIIRLS